MNAWDEYAAALEHAATIPGPAAFLLARLGLLPSREEATRQLDRAGIRGTPRAEFWREQVLAGLDRIEREGGDWHAAHRGDDQADEPAGSAAVEPLPGGSASSAPMREVLTTSEAARRLDVIDRRVRQLASAGKLGRSRIGGDGRWQIDATAVEARAAGRNGR